MDYMYRELRSYSEKIYDLDDLFYYEEKTDMLYCHDDELGRAELSSMGYPYAYSDDFDFLEMPEEMITLLNDMRANASEKNNENFLEFVKDCYEKLLQCRTYTAIEYNKLHDEKTQLEKTLTAIKALL